MTIQMGPLVGGFAVQARGWTWTIWELMWLSGFTLIVLIFLMPETSSSNILYRRTMRLRRLTGNNKLICEPQLIGENMTGKDIVMMTMVRPFTLCFTEPMVFALNMYIALIYGLLYIWVR
jgi:MFS transporter, DHA1 family, multidrug resistance protein